MGDSTNHRAIEIQNIVIRDQRQTQMCDVLCEFDMSAELLREAAKRLMESDDPVESTLGLLALSGLADVIETLIERKLLAEQEEGKMT